ncbi:GDP-mannose transporter GONST5 [Choanephora cucurbitarum]|uniref:GDP-mannose transporter GONST5 n=1 Tax=Choanephora cucurbitarum TaxID=101091 RepID=A0A1C7NHT9_9FUNG|nr:GDP-mannose transporter GONST5 [Choanephora cucurbitarum]
MATPSEQCLDSSMLWLSMYFFLNLGLTLYNKVIMAMFQFPFPWALTAIHTLCGTIGSYVFWKMGLFKPATLGERENMVMLMFSVLYTINIAISNVSLNLVTVPFHQVVRAMTPVFTVILNVMFLKKSYSSMVYISLIPVIAGVGFATFGDYNYTAMGFFLTVLGTVLAAVKTVVTNRVQVGRLKLHPLDLLLRMSPLAFMQTMLYSYATGEFELVQDYIQTKLTWGVLSALVLNGIIAFFLNVVSFTANKKTSALTMTVAGNVKQVLSIVLAVIIFDLSITATNGLGIILTLAGGAWYSNVQLNEKKSKLSGGESLLGVTDKHENELLDIKTQK